MDAALIAPGVRHVSSHVARRFHKNKILLVGLYRIDLFVQVPEVSPVRALLISWKDST